MKPKRQLVVIAHNIRSTHNVGSILRTAEGLGVKKVILSGYTPYPAIKNDTRLPHLTQKLSRDIHKTALGAENLINWRHEEDILGTIDTLKHDGYQIWAIEQAASSIPLSSFDPPPKCAIIIGREVEGIEPEILKAADGILEIPMFGKKESFNVVQAAAMALYQCIFH